MFFEIFNLFAIFQIIVISRSIKILIGLNFWLRVYVKSICKVIFFCILKILLIRLPGTDSSGSPLRRRDDLRESRNRTSKGWWRSEKWFGDTKSNKKQKLSLNTRIWRECQKSCNSSSQNSSLRLIISENLINSW